MPDPLRSIARKAAHEAQIAWLKNAARDWMDRSSESRMEYQAVADAVAAAVCRELKNLAMQSNMRVLSVEQINDLLSDLSALSVRPERQNDGSKAQAQENKDDQSRPPSLSPGGSTADQAAPETEVNRGCNMCGYGFDDFEGEVCEYCGRKGTRVRLDDSQPDHAETEPRPCWQPIETAPKDGTRVLVAHVRDGVIARVSEARFDGLGWYNNGGEGCHWRTHWMPLPQVGSAPDSLSEASASPGRSAARKDHG